MPKGLSASKLSLLADDIEKIYRDTLSQIAHSVETYRKIANWKIGERIIKVEQDNQIRAQYAEHLLEQISVKLTKKLGKGFSITTLSLAKQFYLAYPRILQISEELSWSNYSILLTVKDDKRRKYYETKAIKKKLKFEELRDLERQGRNNHFY